jgi:DNA-binding response OmpR family regulator
MTTTVVSRDPAAMRRFEREFPPPRILIADDDGEMRSLLCAALTRDGYEVQAARDGSELLERLADSYGTGAEGPFDLVLSDVRMPGWSGVQVLAGLQGPEAPPVILMTAFGDESIHRIARKLGAAATLDKPFDLDLLRALVVNVLSHWEPAAGGRTEAG